MPYPQSPRPARRASRPSPSPRRSAVRPGQAKPAWRRRPSTAGAAELQTALRHMDELGSHEQTRIVCVYELSADVVSKPSEDPSLLTSAYYFGQFAQHIEIAASLLPEPIVTRTGINPGPGGVTLGLHKVKACLLVTPRDDIALVLDGSIPGDADGQRVAEILASTCTKRRELSVGGEPLLDWLQTQATAKGLTFPGGVKFGQNVHQCVFPGGRLLTGIRAGEPFWRESSTGWPRPLSRPARWYSSDRRSSTTRELLRSATAAAYR